jgi:hypothetical protein
VIEIRFGRVHGDDGGRPDPEHRVAVAEELLEVHVAHVARVVVSRDHHHRLTPDPVEVAARLLVFVLEAERGQIARADDDVRLEIVDLGDRPLQQTRHEILPAAVQIGQVRDRKGRALGRRGHAASIGTSRNCRPSPSLP